MLGDSALLQDDPHFRDLIPFHEYFHGDSGRGLGAAHQTGWTGLVALLLQPRVSRMGSLMSVAGATHVGRERCVSAAVSWSIGVKPDRWLRSRPSRWRGARPRRWWRISSC